LSLSKDNHAHALPPHIWDGQPDPALPPLKWVTPADRMASTGPRFLMSNSFAFGGNNVSLIIGDAP
jgi:3-oxoacyl-[acyl-carrier-protein] synthase-1